MTRSDPGWMGWCRQRLESLIHSLLRLQPPAAVGIYFLRGRERVQHLMTAAASAGLVVARLFSRHGYGYGYGRRTPICFSTLSQTTTDHKTKKKHRKKREEVALKTKDNEKSRTRSDIEFELKQQHFDSLIAIQHGGHIPVMLGEVLHVFERPHLPLRSFLDCTLGAAGHSSAIIQAHPELRQYVGLDVDPLAHEKADALLNMVLSQERKTSDLEVCTMQKNFKDVRSVLAEVDDKLLIHGVDGILMDLGVSSMQVSDAERGFSVLGDGPLDMRMNPKASLKAEDILNYWPEAEVGRILREYGEESNWRHLQKKIVKARVDGGLHSTAELVNLVRSMSPMSKGRQGWVKTATRVFQALRIAVNDELTILEQALRVCFECLSSGGRLAVISFHSLEDRIVKQTFLDIVNNGSERLDSKDEDEEEEAGWVKQRVNGCNGSILTKRPITPCEEEEKLNYRCRSAKLRVIQKRRTRAITH